MGRETEYLYREGRRIFTKGGKENIYIYRERECLQMRIRERVIINECNACIEVENM